MLNKIVKLTPHIAEYIWGGTNLKYFWNKTTTAERVAETWELSAFPGKESTVVGGIHDGLTLSQLIMDFPGFFGEKLKKYDVFPLLIKLINSKQPLSIQVHPDDEYALGIEGQLGKTEVWYIAEAEKDAFIYLGFNRDISREEIKRKIENGTLLDALNRINVKVGDFIEIPPGTVHALQGGLTIMEVQENSNVTYRIYDYNRVDDLGNKRELHIEKAIEILCTKKYEEQKREPELIPTNWGKDFLCLTKNMYFCVYKGIVETKTNLFCRDSFISVTVIQGSGSFSTGEEIKKGDTYLIPANKKTEIINMSKELQLICVTLGEI